MYYIINYISLLNQKCKQKGKSAIVSRTHTHTTYTTHTTHSLCLCFSFSHFFFDLLRQTILSILTTNTIIPYLTVPSKYLQHHERSHQYQRYVFIDFVTFMLDHCRLGARFEFEIDYLFLFSVDLFDNTHRQTHNIIYERRERKAKESCYLNSNYIHPFFFFVSLWT